MLLSLKRKLPIELFLPLFWGTLAGVFSQGFNFITNIFLVRILGLEYGELVLYISTNSMLQTFGIFGLNVMATVIVAKSLSTNKNDLSTSLPGMYYIVLLLSILISFVTLIIQKSGFIDFRLWQFESYIYIVIALIWFLTSTLDVLQISILSGFSAFKDLSKVSLIKGIVNFALVLLFAFFWGVKGVLASYAISFIISLLLNFYFINKNSNKYSITYSYKFSKRTTFKILKSSLPIFMAALVIVPSQWGVNYLVFHEENGALALSIFGVANQWLVLIQFFPLQISKVILPILVKEKNNRSVQKIGLYLSTIIAVLIISFSFIFERNIISLYNFDYEITKIPYRIMLIASLFSVLNMDFISSIVSSTFLNSSSEKNAYNVYLIFCSLFVQ